MIRTFKQAACCTAAVFLMGMTAHAEMVSNPEYENWSRFKPGAMSKLEANSVANGQTMKSVMTNKLLEVTPEKAVVESSAVMEMMGQTMQGPSMKREVPAKIDQNQLPKTPTGETADPKTSKTEETVTAAGKEYKCKVTETVHENNGTKAIAKAWMCDEVPGGLVKSEIKTTGQMESTTNMMLVETSKGG